MLLCCDEKENKNGEIMLLYCDKIQNYDIMKTLTDFELYPLEKSPAGDLLAPRPHNAPISFAPTWNGQKNSTFYGTNLGT